MFTTYYVIHMYALNTKGLKAGSVYALNKEYALNNGVCLTTRLNGTVPKQEVDWQSVEVMLMEENWHKRR